MAKTLTLEFEYAAPPAAVIALIKDQAFRESVCEAQHASAYTVTVAGDTIHVSCLQAVRGVPSFAQKFVGDSVELVQHETWSADSAALTLTIPGKPGEISGTRTLAAAGDGALETYSLTAKVGIPLVGGKLEDVILGIFKSAARREHRTVSEALGA